MDNDCQSLCSEASFGSAGDTESDNENDRYLFEKPSTNLMDFLSQKDFLEDISKPVAATPGEIMVLLLKFCLKYELSFSATSSLFTLINSIFKKPILPESRYLLDKILNPANKAEFHAVCPNCSKYLGKSDDICDENILKCPSCHSNVNVSNPSEPSFFAIIDPTEQISQYLPQHAEFYDWVMNERPENQHEISDIFDGIKYREFLSLLEEAYRRRYVTLTLSTDGVPVFKSSKYSIWPIYLMINELPIEYRFKTLIPCGLWFSKNEPDMPIFLNPLVDKLNELGKEGLQVDILGEIRTVRPFVLIGIFDTPARSKCNGTVRFNGKFGCDWCLHPTHWDEIGKATRYPVAYPIPIDRDRKQMIEWSVDATNKYKPVYGVKYVTALYYLQKFDIIWGVVPDYMHCCLLGVGKQFLDLYFDRMDSRDYEYLNNLMQKMRLPNQCSRFPRSFKDRAYWKAKEYENFILFYSVPLLDLVLDNRYIKHWNLFVESLYILLKKSITKTELEEANKNLHQFVYKAQDLYGLEVMTYNVHQLLHLADSVRNWGPLWAHSAFATESKNGDVSNSINGAKGVILQMIRNINMTHSYNTIEKFVLDRSSEIIKSQLDRFILRRTKNYHKSDNVSYLSSRKYCLQSQFLAKFNLPSNSYRYTRILKDRCIYASNAKKNVRSCNYYAQLKDSSFVKLKYFIYDPDTKSNITICEKLITERSNRNKNIHFVKGSDCIILIPTSKLRTVCVIAELESKIYVCPLPNTYFYN